MLVVTQGESSAFAASCSTFGDINLLVDYIQKSLRKAGLFVSGRDENTIASGVFTSSKR